MSDDAPRPSPAFLASVQPVVLVGGKSTRFGRDKLREPVGESGELLVQRPIKVLRQTFGPRVKLVGECHPDIVPLADGVIADEHPGIGPMGGILSALSVWGGPICVLAGDMPHVAHTDVLNILQAAEQAAGPIAVLAETDRTHMCAGVYFPSALPMLQCRQDQGDYRLAGAIPTHLTQTVLWRAASAANVNNPCDLSSGEIPRR